MPVLSGRTNFDPFSKTWKFFTPKFPMKYRKMVKILHHLKILEMWYLRHAEHHAKDRTSLCDLDQETLFFDWPLISWEILEWKFFKFLKMDQSWFYLIEQASDMSKITLSFIFYAWSLIKTITKINKPTNEQFNIHFFWLTPCCLTLFCQVILELH